MIDALTGYDVRRWDLGWAFAADGACYVVYFMPMSGAYDRARLWEQHCTSLEAAFKLWQETVATFRHYGYAENT